MTKEILSLQKKYNLPIRIVIKPKDSKNMSNDESLENAYTGDGILVNSDIFSGLENQEAIKKNL